MIVEQMSTADLLREGKQAMALAMGSVGPDTRARWRAVMAEIDTRLAVGDLDEDDLEGRVQAIAKQRDEAIAQMNWANKRIIANSDNLQFVLEAFNANHPALKGAWGSDLSHGAKLLWEWYRQTSKGLLREFPLFDEQGLDPFEHCCEWTLLEERKRLHVWLKENGHV
jgi:hypothetical protein